MAIVYVNNLQRSFDANFNKVPKCGCCGGFIAKDPTSRFVLGQGDMIHLSTPPYNGSLGLKAAIDGNMEEEEENRGVWLNYSDINKGDIQYYVNTEFVNPFTRFFDDKNNLDFKQVLPDGTIEYSRQRVVPIQKASSFDSRFDQELLANRDPRIEHPNFLVSTTSNQPNQEFVDSQNQREDIQALQLRTVVRHEFTPAFLF
jgi:hypothetical protein